MRGAILFCAVMVLFIAVATPPAGASMAKIPVAGNIVYATYDSPGVSWMVGSGLRGSYEMRGATETHSWASDSPYLQGTAQVVVNLTQSWACNADTLECAWTGRFWGTIVWYPDAYPHGGWQGTFTHRITACEDATECDYSGTGHAGGFGELEGLRLILDVETQSATGYVLAPA